MSKNTLISAAIFLLGTTVVSVDARAPVNVAVDPVVTDLGFQVESTVPAADAVTPVGRDDIALDHAHPATGFAAPNILTGTMSLASANGTGDFRLAENSDHLAGGTRDSVSGFEAHFGSGFEYNINSLPNYGSFPDQIWPGDYLPTFRDGANFPWAGPSTQSPIQKYARAFGLPADRVAAAISQLTGIDSMRNIGRQSCNSDRDCEGLNDGSACAKKAGEFSSGVCIPTWFGLCHAWAPAAILEPEPRCPVTYNGVTFEINDLKALIIQLYDGSHIRTVFGGNRCNDAQPQLDQYGRYASFECRDLTPDFWHLAVTNIMGIRGQSFVVDIDDKAEVWNHPLHTYTFQQETISLQEGARRYGLNDYPFNPRAVSLAQVNMRFWFMVETTQNAAFVRSGRANEFLRTRDLEYFLELDEAGNIIGGEWVGGSKTSHPDFLWLPYTRPSDGFSVAGISYNVVKQLLALSLQAQC
ncbi:hypothetical protein HK102_013818 [Quaeritorhiza haematococci]|nr:hypothetical protein HK102_013818 [Quaeritorhiza haematococci]